MAGPAGLSIVEIKATGAEFVVLQNNTSNRIDNLSSYWLTSYNNANPLAVGATSSQQQLPVGSLPAGGTLLLSADPMATCGASVAGDLGVSLADSSGFLQLGKVSLNDSGAVVQTPSDFVSWSSSATGAIQNVPSSTKNPAAVYYRHFDGTSYVWQLAGLGTDACQLNVVVAGGPGSSIAVTPLALAATSPPATILGTVTSSDGVASIPAADVGLTAPQLTELLPNPMGTGNDATDEFIELYNPNDKPFDLTGFILQTGTTTAHNYTFPDGTSLAPKAFHAFYASQTKLTLSNTSGQAALLDPRGNVLGQADLYSTAKDGFAWALAQNKWQWTMKPTPNEANVVQTPASKTTSKSAASKKATPAVKGSSKSSATTAAATDDGKTASGVIHVWVLALVAGVALLYGAYEYRRDLGNRLYQLGAKLNARSKLRRLAFWGRSD